MGADYSSKLCPWLACGAISPRFVYHETKRFEAKFLENESTKHFISELFWRDVCHWYCFRHGPRVFYEYGALEKGQQWKTNLDLINRWKNGTTGIPIIDAFMRELKFSGFMSNRGRQIVASFLTLDLKQDWRYGAQHFEETLIDHDVHSNYASWNFAAGLGPSKVLLFNVIK
jgi:deoxyribodipyrimidine photo-lyase